MTTLLKNLVKTAKAELTPDEYHVFKKWASIAEEKDGFLTDNQDVKIELDIVKNTFVGAIFQEIYNAYIYPHTSTAAASAMLCHMDAEPEDFFNHRQISTFNIGCYGKEGER